jgi:hypothetical protein
MSLWVYLIIFALQGLHFTHFVISYYLNESLLYSHINRKGCNNRETTVPFVFQFKTFLPVNTAGEEFSFLYN